MIATEVTGCVTVIVPLVTATEGLLTDLATTVAEPRPAAVTSPV